MTSSSATRSSSRISAGGTGRLLRSRLSSGTASGSNHVDADVVPGGDNTSPHQSPLNSVDAVVTPPKPEGYTLVPPNTPVLEFGRKRRLSASESSIEWSPSPPSKRHNTSSDEEIIGTIEQDTSNSAPSPTLCSDKSISDEEHHAVVGPSNAIAKILDNKDRHTSQLDSTSPVKPSRLVNKSSNNDGSDSPTAKSIPSSQAVGSSANKGTGVKTIPAHSFTNPRNIGMWSKAVCNETSGAVVYMVTYMPSSDAWSQGPIASSIMDPDMSIDGLYDGLPAYPLLQFVFNSTPPNVDVMELDEEGNIIRHAMSIEAWLSFGLTKQQCIRYITFNHNGLNFNPARDSLLLLSAMSYSMDSKTKFFKDTAPKTQFYAVERGTSRPVLFWSLGVITSVFLNQPCAESGRPIYRGVHAVLQRWERERMGAFFSMLFRNVHLQVQIDGNSAFVFQTRFQSTSSSQRTTLDSYVPTTSFTGPRIAKFNIPTYRTPLKEVTPPPYFNRGYAYTAQVPVYDARGCDFNPMNIDSSLEGLPPFTGEVPEGSSSFIGYGAGTSVFKDVWKITFYVRYIVIISTPV